MIVSVGNASPQLLRMFDAFPLARLASKEDSERLANFMNEHSMQAGLLDLTFTRGNDYFSLLELQGHRSITIFIEQNGKVMALGSLTIRHSYMRRKKCVVGYFQDLRISSDAPATVRLMIYNCMTELVRLSPHIPDTENCNFFYTAILSNNFAAKAALSRHKFVLEYTKLFAYRALVVPKLPGFGLLSKFCSALEISFDSALKFYESNLGGLAFDIDLDQFSRLRKFSKAIGVLDKGELQGVCLIVDINIARQMNLRLFKSSQSYSLLNTLIFGLRVSKSLSADEKSALKAKLFRGAVFHSSKLPGIFCGYIQVEDDIKVGPLPFLTSRSTRGDVYRVYHPDNLRVDGFEAGFLRPDHLGAFEWVLS
jgi:hypothetical protein